MAISEQNSRTIVAVIEGTYPWYRGGVSEWVYRYLLAFPDYRFRIIQIATDEWNRADLSTALYPVPEQIELFERTLPPVLPELGWEQAFTEWFEQQPNLLSICQGADWVHVTNTGFAGWLGKMLSHKTDLPLMLTEHALYWQEVNMGTVALECGYKIPTDQTRRDVVADGFKTIAEQVYQSAVHTISVSRCNLPEQERLGATKPIYIPNGVEAHWIKATKARGTDLTIGWIGRCAAIKNPLRFFDLADAFRERNGADADVPVSFRMLLSDAVEHDLERQVRARAERYPEVTMVWNESTIDHIDTMDALCITSNNESQPLVLFEALARQVLPVGWTVGDATDRYGLLYPKTTTAVELAAGILKAWTDPESWQNQLTPRHNMVRKEHTWDAVFQQYRVLFSDR